MDSKKFFKEWGNKVASSEAYTPNEYTHTHRSITWNEVFEAFMDRLYNEKVADEMKPKPECDHELGYLFHEYVPYGAFKKNGIRVWKDSDDEYGPFTKKYKHCPECGDKLK